MKLILYFRYYREDPDPMNKVTDPDPAGQKSMDPRLENADMDPIIEKNEVPYIGIKMYATGSSDPSYIVSYYIKWVTTSWTHSIFCSGSCVHFCRMPCLYLIMRIMISVSVMYIPAID